MNHSRFIFLIVVVIPLIGLFHSCGQSEPSKKEGVSSLDQKLTMYCDLEAEQGFSGVIAIKRPNEDLFFKCIGYSDLEKQIKNDKNTVFDIGSLTKQFTGAAILKLEMAGKLSVEDSLVKYFPEIPDDKRGITIHHLLTHSAGFPWSIGSDNEIIHKVDFVKRAFNTELLFSPGEKFGYSHVGYSLLGILIEKITNASYELFLKENLFDPCGMSNTGYVLPNWDLSKVAKGYRKCKDWGKPMDLSWGSEGPYWNLKATAGLLSTASDLMLWHAALDGIEILDEASKEKFLNSHIRESDISGSYYSYGWVINTSRRGTKAFAHDAGNGMFFSDWINYPQEQVSILVLMNDYRPGSRSIASEIAWILFYPHHEFSVNLKSVECYDSLPDTRIGEIAGRFIEMLSSDQQEDIESLFNEYLGDHIKGKYTKDFIFGTLRNIQKDAGPTQILDVVVVGNDYMEIVLRRNSDQIKIRIRLKFDKEDDYKIRRFNYFSNEP